MENKKVELTKERIIGNQRKELQQLAAENCFFRQPGKERPEGSRAA